MKAPDERIKVGCYCRFYATGNFNVSSRKKENVDETRKTKFKRKEIHKKRLLGTVESINYKEGTAVIFNSYLNAKFNRKLSDLKFYS